MRRKDKEIRDKEVIDAVIKRAKVCRIGLSDNNTPYIIPLNYGYKDNCLYFHSAPEGKKIDIIKRNNAVCFEIDIDHEIFEGEIPCKSSMKYYSIIGLGRAYLIDDLAEKANALNIIMSHYFSKSNYEYPDVILKKIIIIKVEIEELTGKKSGY